MWRGKVNTRVCRQRDFASIVGPHGLLGLLLPGLAPPSPTISWCELGHTQLGRKTPQARKRCRLSRSLSFPAWLFAQSWLPGPECARWRGNQNPLEWEEDLSVPSPASLPVP